jgi:NAD(P)-dependent dehydrogenase (short-subunit alcohol dehydrogenase family)
MRQKPTALVTGGARRIGEAIVRELAAHGFQVAIHCNRSLDEANTLADELRVSGAEIAIVRGDLADVDSLSKIVTDATRALGPLTLLVNNASVILADSYGGLDNAVWQTQFDVNLRAPVFLAEAFAAQLPDGCDGNIVNIIDHRVLKLTPKMPSYTLTKAALWTATQTLAQALAPRIRVNGIGPGPTFANPHSTDPRMTKEVDGVPLRRAVDAADIARAVRFLVETPSITGELILVDSGQHLGWETPDIVGRPA